MTAAYNGPNGIYASEQPQPDLRFYSYLEMRLIILRGEIAAADHLIADLGPCELLDYLTQTRRGRITEMRQVEKLLGVPVAIPVRTRPR